MRPGLELLGKGTKLAVHEILKMWICFTPPLTLSEETIATEFEPDRDYAEGERMSGEQFRLRLTHLGGDFRDNIAVHLASNDWAICLHHDGLFLAIFDYGLLLAERVQLQSSFSTPLQRRYNDFLHLPQSG